MAALSGGLNPNVVKTALDDVVFPEYQYPAQPEEALATDAMVFRQRSTDKGAEILEVFKGVGLFETRAEEADVPSDSPRVDDQATHTVINYSKSVDVTKNLFDDGMFNVVGEMMTEFGAKARITRDDTAMSNWRNAFTTFTAANGTALISNTQANINGDTIDNLETAALTESALETMVVSLREQKDQAGVIRGHVPACLLVPPALFKEACEILDSELRSGTANNDVNVYSSKYGIMIKTSPHLGSAAGGSDTAHFLLARNHKVYRWERQGLVTDLVDYKFQRNNNYIYKGEFREVYGAMTYEGVVGSNGTT